MFHALLTLIEFDIVGWLADCNLDSIQGCLLEKGAA
jgi:hypothetical protein